MNNQKGQIDPPDHGESTCSDDGNVSSQALPPSYESACVAETNVDQSSAPLVHGESCQAVGGQQKEDGHLTVEEKKKLHDEKIKKLISDLRRECSVEGVAPEEIEMLDVGTDHVLSESDMSSLHSSLKAKNEHQDPASVSLADEADGIDRVDESIMRLSFRLSVSELQEITAEASLENNDQNPELQPFHDIDSLRDEASMEDGADGPNKTHVLVLLAGSPTRKLIVVGSVLFCLGLLLLVILLPKSFVYVNYYEYAMARNVWTGAVDYSMVYDTGCYLLKPQDELIRFEATAHFMNQKLVIMDSTGLSIKLDIMLQYFLRRDEIPQLFQRYHYAYKKVMRSLVESEVKNLAIRFTLDQYRLHRQKVEAAILKRIQYALSGDCCDDCCPDNCGRKTSNCDASVCRPKGSCHRGHHVRVKFFQMGAIMIPEEVFERLVQRIILQVEAEREHFFQLKAVEVKKTEQVAQNIRNKAEELRQKARALERVIHSKAEAEKNRALEKACQVALKRVFSHFNITDEDNKLSYIYAHALAEKADNIHYIYGYDSLSASSP